jgi:hypothetical protein
MTILAHEIMTILSHEIMTILSQIIVSFQGFAPPNQLTTN